MKNKRYILVLFVFFISVNSEEWSCGDDCTAVLENGVLKITGTGKMNDYSYNSFPWFSSRSSIKTVEIGEGIATIGEYAFYKCPSLTSITIPNSVTTIGNYAFSSCSSLTSITIPDGVTTIGERAFYYCRSLTSITIPDSVTTIGNYAFSSCSSLTSITIPDGVAMIGGGAFIYCSSLTSVTIPNSVTTIGSWAFSECLKLASGSIGSIDWKLNTETGDMTFTGNGKMMDFEYPSARPWYESKGSIEKVTISEGITTIGNYAFEGCSSLPSITIPNSVTTIGNSAFSDCNPNLSLLYRGTSSPTCLDEWATVGNEPNVWVSSECTETDFCGITPSRYGKIGEKNDWFFNSRYGSLVINGTGSISQTVFSDNFSSLPVESITSIKIQVGIDTIQSNTFNGYSNLEELEITNNNKLEFDVSVLPAYVTSLIVSNTLAYGRTNIANLQCENSCIDDSKCTLNDECECEKISLSICPSGCDKITGQCRSCKNLIKSVCEKSSACDWKVSEKKMCGWCQVKTNNDVDSETPPDYCDKCAIRESSDLCVVSGEPEGCEWCKLNYCSREGKCEIRCELISTKEDCKKETEKCSWCPTTLSCIDNNARCNKCSDFSSNFCPRGCDCSSSKLSTAAILIIVVVVACVVLIAVLLVFMFVVKKRFGYQGSGTNEMTALSDIMMTLNPMFGFDDDDDGNSSELCANYANGDISEFISCSDDDITFGQSTSFLLLSKTYSSSFQLTNKSEEDVTIELFACGFQEKHKINFIPQKVLIERSKTKTITIEITFECSAMLTPTTAKVCCGIVEKEIKNAICGIQAQTELSPLLSVDDLVIQKEIGRGSFGKVYKGIYKGNEVAIKKFSGLTTQSNNNEIDIFAKIRSPYVVNFYGICRAINSMVIEYCKYGSVESCYGNKKLTDDVKKLMCYDCAMGMNYLHQNGIIHRDLKPDNLLAISFSKDKNTVRVKLSDFGTSRLSTKTMKMTEAIGTPGFMAPEVFEGDEYGKKSDVYSFGMTVWAIYAEKNPFDDITSVSAIFSSVAQGKRPELISNCPLNDLIASCWEGNPAQRPTFADILEKF